MKRTVLLVILDGWGIGRDDQSNPIYVAQPENLLSLEKKFPVTSLQASGISVGLPWSEVGNSEVGHLTLGAGKVVYQYFPRITLAIENGSFFENPALRGAFDHAKKHGSAVNMVGLLTKGNVYASLEHLKALLRMAEKEGVASLKIHLFSDGKDSPPRSILELLKEIPRGALASIVGRYYAMDHEENWQLTEKAYGAITGELGAEVADPLPAILETFAQGYSEEFLAPLRLSGRAISDNDAAIFFNFREDGIEQLARIFIVKDAAKFRAKSVQNLYIATMTRYSPKFSVPVAFEPDTVQIPLGKALSDHGKNQLRLAETYKYAHVTYFFNGYREPPFKNEYRVLIPSYSTPHIEKYPAMMASAITDRVVQSLETQGFDFVLANYANPDTIAHTGNFDAALEAVRSIDSEIGRILKVGLNDRTVIIITSDHGNIEQMLNPLTAIPETQHDISPVPFYLIAPEFAGRTFLNQVNRRTETAGILSDVAPTILDLMKIPKPKEMSGESLLQKLT